MRINKRNIAIELWRFVFMMVIVIFHFCGNCSYARNEGDTFWFENGYIYVEFFFILTGFLTAKHFDKVGNDEENLGLSYAKNKCFRMLPTALFIVVIDFFIRYGAHRLDDINVGDMLFKLILNLFFITTTYSPDGDVTIWQTYPAQFWYLSSMFLSLPVICIILNSKMKKAYSSYLAGLLFVVYYGRMGFVARGPWPSDILRGFVSMSMGVFLYAIGSEMHRHDNKWINVVKYIIGNACMVISVYLSYNANIDRYIMVFLFILGMLLLFNYEIDNNVFFLQEGLLYKIICFLGDMSFYIFCVHFTVITALNRTEIVMDFGRHKGLLIYLIVTLLSAYGLNMLNRYLVRSDNKHV